MIDNLTLEQITRISVHREKWRSLALSTDRIDRQQATEAVKNLYETIGVKPPTIAWFDSPYAVLVTVAPLLDNQLINPVAKQLKKELGGSLVKELKSQATSKIYRGILKELKTQLEKQLKNQFQDKIKKELAGRLRTELISQLGEEFKGKYKQIVDLMVSQSIAPESFACWGSLLDFAKTELECNLDEKKWFAFQSVVNSCGWIFPFANTVIVCDRPAQLLFNDKGLLHAEAKPAISFPDKYSIYASNGVILPVQYGMLPLSKWRSKWLLKNHPPELKKAIIQAIGKTIMRQELTDEELKIVLREQAEYAKQQEAKKQELQQSLSVTGIRELDETGSKETLAKNQVKPLIRKNKKQAHTIKTLTQEQENSIKKLDKKWQNLAIKKSHKQEDRDAKKAINKARYIIKKSVYPTVIFCANPAEGVREIISDEVLIETVKKLIRYLRSKSHSQLRVDAVSHLNHKDLMTSIESLRFALGDDVKSRLNRMLNSIEIYSPLAELGERLEGEISSQIEPKLKREIFKNLKGIKKHLKTNLERKIYHPLIEEITEEFWAALDRKVGENLEKKLGSAVRRLLVSELMDSCAEELERKLYSKFADLGKYYQLGAYFDFCISVLGCKCDADTWSAFEELAANCPWIYARDNTWVVARVSLSDRVKGPEATVRVSSEQKPPTPVWKKGFVGLFVATFGLPLLVTSRLLDLVNFSIKSFKFLGELIWLLIVVAPIEIGTRSSWLLIGIFRLVIQCFLFAGRIAVFPFVWLLNSIFSRFGIAENFDRDFDSRYSLDPRGWKAWLLTESDPEMFNAVIEEMGYVRISQELRNIELDSWREYSLLQFVDLMDPADLRRVVVLKMTCPSTGSVHALRVPPETRSAREAVRWVNWGTDPQEFVVET